VSAASLLGLLSLIAANITRPLRDMVRAADSIARGDLAHRLDIQRGDEIGRLAGSFNRMAEDLQEANAKLTQWGRTLEKLVTERTRELREMQEAVVQSEKLASLGKLAAGVAHEINNPLTTILIYAHLLLERCGDRPEFRERLTLIADETARCARIVKGLLEFARLTPSREVLADVNEILDRVVQLLENQASVRNIRMIKSLDRDLPAVALDANKIQQVFSNLAINACEAMPEGGTLTVDSRRGSDGATLEVSFADTGVGIPKENLPRLFDPFFTTKDFGTGLGLAVSYGIVRRRGGTIDVRSEVGRGSVFLVRLPLEGPAEEGNGEEGRS
jgi:two-component system NtrC family sensor kinase